MVHKASVYEDETTDRCLSIVSCVQWTTKSLREQDASMKVVHNEAYRTCASASVVAIVTSLVSAASATLLYCDTDDANSL